MAKLRKLPAWEVMVEWLIREDEKVDAFILFWEKHGRHSVDGRHAVRVHEGDWSLAFECKECDVAEGYAIDNEARRAALALRDSTLDEYFTPGVAPQARARKGLSMNFP